jgi:cyclase
MKTVQLATNVFVKTETRGCNFGYVVTSEGVVLIDAPGDPAYVEDYTKELAKLGKIRYIINTEYHFDHNMTNGFFDTPVIASDITKALIPTNTDRWMRQATERLYAEPFTVPSPETYRKGWPSITFPERMTLSLGEYTFQIILLPGHTAGQTVVYIPEEKIVFASDNVSASGVVGGLHDAVPYKYLESLEFLKTLDVRAIQTGHGDLLTSNIRSCLDKLSSSLRERVEAVENFKAEGIRVREAAELWEKMFPEQPRPASEGFAPRGAGGSRFALAHLYQVIGGNTGY